MLYGVLNRNRTFINSNYYNRQKIMSLKELINSYTNGLWLILS